MTARLLLPLGGLLLVGALCVPGGAHADGDEGETPREAVRRTVDLTGYAAPRPVAGPNMATPADLLAHGRDGADMWNADPGDERLGWLEFEGASIEDSALSGDELATLLHALFPQLDDGESHLGLTESGALTLRASAGEMPQLLRGLRWLLDALAPALEVDAALLQDAPEEALRATGSVRLWPGRWTRVYFRKHEVPCVVDYDIEVAVEATVMDPQVHNIVEGEELYLRFHPGESRGVLEVWAGDLTHVEMERVDLAGLQNVPEANGPGVLTFPRTRIRRAFTAFSFPMGGRARHELRWSQPDGATRLALDLTAPVASEVIWPHHPEYGMGPGYGRRVFWIGALASGLEFDSRPRLADLLLEEAGTWAEAQAAAEGGDEGYEWGAAVLASGEAVAVESSEALLRGWREQLVARERALDTARVQLRLVAVPEEAYRRALLAGSLRVGGRVAPETLDQLTEAGALEQAAVRVPVLHDMRAGFRLGFSQPGLIDMDAEIAQQSAGLTPRSWALFAGLFGDVRVRRAEGGHGLHLHGEVVWADAEAGRMELAYRPPLSMRGTNPAAALEGVDKTRRVVVPLLGGGSSTFEREVVVPAGGRDEVLVHAVVQGREVRVLLATVR